MISTNAVAATLSIHLGGIYYVAVI